MLSCVWLWYITVVVRVVLCVVVVYTSRGTWCPVCGCGIKINEMKGTKANLKGITATFIIFKVQ